MGNNVHFFRQSGGVGGDAFISTFKTTTANESITLPYLSGGTYSGTIDWGDGTVVANSFANSTHTYAVAGDYDVTVLGDLIGFAFNGGGDRLKIFYVKNWGVGIQLERRMFKGCENLDITATDTPTINTNNLSDSFRECSSLVWNDSINNWDVSSVTILNLCFLRSDLFNQPLNNWDVSSVTSMRNCFQETAFNQPLNNWDISSCSNINTMFKDTPFNQDISSWNFSLVGSLSEFMQLKTFNDYDAAYYDNLLIKWASSPSVGGLTPNIIGTIDMGTIKYTANGASARASILANNKAQVINDGGIDLINSTPFISVFRTTTANESITLPYLSSGTYSGTIDWGDGTVVANSYVNRTHTYTTDGFYTVTILGDCVGWLFNNGGDKLKIYDIINWGIGFKFNNTLLPNGIFRGCANLNITAVDSLDLSNINYIVNLFRSCSNLQFNNSINDWDISSIERIEACFYFCNSFNQPLNNWDTTNVQRMTFLFGNCFAFNQDISAWDFSGLNNVNGLASFMAGKSSANYNAEYYDNLLIKWASDPSLGGLQPNIIGTIDMGTIKYTANGASARQSILDNNKAVTINDGGQI